MDDINDYKTFISLAGLILSLINFWFIFWRQRTKFDVKITEIVDCRVDFYIEFLFINKSDKPLSIVGIKANTKKESFDVVYYVQNIMSSKYFEENYKTNGLPVKLDPYQSTKCYIQFKKNTVDKDFEYDKLKLKFSTSRQPKTFFIPIKKDLIIERSDLYHK